MNISVVYALPDHQEVVAICCPPETTIRQAIQKSGICGKFPQIDLAINEVGVHGLKQDLDYILCENDRVEIYRPLLISPTEARRLRAESRQRK